ncbi:hypothetical protein AZ78_4184 [Lysobacter capsici AZ78]|uniref:Uncharacterized protein n=1 Tax=Lysobacter capsici AZ78 TaxID=1444315 RepID=A0A108UCF8_9GAMM|nr:hypothetical protein AZ78_4184 [Lysobacter capsici AZ78]
MVAGKSLNSELSDWDWRQRISPANPPLSRLRNFQRSKPLRFCESRIPNLESLPHAAPR